jgi:hypothetical protein
MIRTSYHFEYDAGWYFLILDDEGEILAHGAELTMNEVAHHAQVKRKRLENQIDTHVIRRGVDK